MPKVHGKSADLWVGATQIETDGNRMTLTITPDTAETTAFASLAKEFVEGNYGWTFAYDGYWNSATNANDQTFYQRIGQGGVELKIFPSGSAVTKIFYLGTAILTSFNSEETVGGAVTCSAAFIGSGCLSRGTA